MIYILFVRNFIGNRYKESKWVLSIIESLILFFPVLFVTYEFFLFSEVYPTWSCELYTF